MKTNILKSLLSIACLLCSIAVYAHDFEVDGIYYKITDKTKNKVEVTYGGTSSGFDVLYTGDVVIPETVTYSGNTYSVTSIGVSAFSQSTDMTSITIPNSVTSIGDGAFIRCLGLKSITIPNSVIEIQSDAFKACQGLTSVTMGNSVTTIGSNAFYNCKGLTEITIPESVTSIGSLAFYGCI